MIQVNSDGVSTWRLPDCGDRNVVSLSAVIARRVNIVVIALGAISCGEISSGHDPGGICNQLDDCGNCDGYVVCPIGGICNREGTSCDCPEGLFASDGECVDNALRCYSHQREEYVDCSEAVENDFCDTDASFPMRSFLREGVWDGATCVPCEDVEVFCGLGLDGDCDGLIDCADDDCMAQGVCTIWDWDYTCGDTLTGVDLGDYETNCTDGKDNDGDGHIDCFDRDCIYGRECLPFSFGDLCACTDWDEDGLIFEDWGDVHLTLDTGNYETAYRCAQVYSPYCDDGEVREFLDWMIAHNYHPRITAIHANDATIPEKRAAVGENPTFQEYFDRRAEADDVLDDGVFQIGFVEVVATDEDIVNEPHTEAEVDEYLQPYFEHIFGHPIDFMFDTIELDFNEMFGPPVECAHQPEALCFEDGVREFFLPLYRDSHNIYHIAAAEFADGTAIGTGGTPGGWWGCQTCFGAIRRVDRSQSMMFHEFGHSIRLPHPLSVQSVVTENVQYLLGGPSIMSVLGYVYGSPELFNPLERYALEPDNGSYLDDETFGPEYSAEILICR